jgi:Fic-DOC domain mobile mystery protein B
MGLDLEYRPGQTPLDEEEKEGLQILTISTKGELDEFEQKNIEQAIQWTIGRKFKAETIISESFIKKMHSRMYAEVWSWAGSFRKSNKIIGVDRWQISTEVQKLLEDTFFWIENKSFPEDEIAIRFKHRIVRIHCFPNGNGRHSRLMGDLVAEKIFNRPPFAWGRRGLPADELRTEYLKALGKADKGHFIDLIQFARTSATEPE